jgi:hypothetical protein
VRRSGSIERLIMPRIARRCERPITADGAWAWEDADMLPSSPPGDRLPALSDRSVRLVDTGRLAVRVGQLQFWDVGLQFHLEVILRTGSASTPRLVSTCFDVYHEDDVPFTLRVHFPGSEVVLDSQSTSQEDGGFGLFRSGGHQSFGPTSVTRVDDIFWLTPIPEGAVRFEVICDAIGLPASFGDLDVAAAAAAAR